MGHGENNLLGSQPDFHQGKEERHMLGEDTAAGPWVPEGTLEGLGGGRGRGQSFERIGV